MVKAEEVAQAIDEGYVCVFETAKLSVARKAGEKDKAAAASTLCEVVLIMKSVWWREEQVEVKNRWK